MGLGLDPNHPLGPEHESDLALVHVRDAFDSKPSDGLDHDPGVVLVLDSFTVGAPESLIGKPIGVQAPTGRDWDVVIDEVRDHGGAISLFIKNLTSRERPIGSIVSMDLADHDHSESRP